MWPFTDTIFVAGSISAEELRRVVLPLQPDEVGIAEEFGLLASVAQAHGTQLLAVWWD
jgi:hypothetical protein